MHEIRQLITQTTGKLKRYSQHMVATVFLLVLVVIVYGQDLHILLNEALHSEALTHVLLIPFFAGYLLYIKRDLVKAALTLDNLRSKTNPRFLDEMIGVALCLIAFLTYWYGSHTFYSLQYHLLSLPLFLMGVTLILFNLKTLTILFFPLLFLVFLTPPPTEFMYTIGGAMANFNTYASYTLLKTIGIPVTLTSTYGPPTITLTTANTPTFTIDLPCSGIYTFIAFAMFAFFLSLIAVTSLPKKLVVFTLGFVTFQSLNIIRITTIVAIGHWINPDIAMQLFHNVSGLLLIFTGMLLMLLTADKLLKIQLFPTSPPQEPCPKCTPSRQQHEPFCINCGTYLHPAALHNVTHRFWGKLALLILGCSILTLSIHAPTFAVAQDQIQLTTGWETASDVLPIIPDHQLKFLYRDESYEEIAGQDAALMYAYFPTNRSHPTVYVDLGVANSISNLHNWEVCLVAWQTAHGQYPLVTVLDSRDTQLLEDTPIIARYFTFQSPENYTQVTLYWYEQATFNLGFTVNQKYVRISLIILAKTATNYQKLESHLYTFAQQIAAHWKPLKTQSLISLGIPAQQVLLALSISFVTITKTIQHSNKWRRKTHNQKIFTQIAPPHDKQVLDTIQHLSERTPHLETRQIHNAVQKGTKKPLKFNKLQETLRTLENYGFITKDLTSIHNIPKLIWKITY